MNTKNSYLWGLLLAILGFLGIALTHATVLSLFLVMLGLVLMIMGPVRGKKKPREQPRDTPPTE